MNNTPAKNVIYSFGTTNLLPHPNTTNGTSLFTDIDVNANIDQLIDNDLFNYLHAENGGAIGCGPLKYDFDTLSSAPNGTKFWKEGSETDTMTILRKENHPLSDSISRFTTENPYFVDKTGIRMAVGTSNGVKQISGKSLLAFGDFPSSERALVCFSDGDGRMIVGTDSAIFVLGFNSSMTETWIRTEFAGNGTPQTIKVFGHKFVQFPVKKCRMLWRHFVRQT